MDLGKFKRTPFLGWSAPAENEQEIFAAATVRAEKAREFLDNDIVVEAYQSLLDVVTDEMLNCSSAEPEKVLTLHNRAQALMGLVLQMKTYMNEVEVLDAERKRREQTKANRKPSNESLDP